MKEGRDARMAGWLATWSFRLFLWE